MAEVDVLMMLFIQQLRYIGDRVTRLEALMSRRELVGILGLELLFGLGSSC